MNEQPMQTPETPAPQQTSGIFEPKPLPPEQMPLTGVQKAWRAAAVIAALLLVFTVWLMLRNPFMKPVNRYFKELSRRDPAAMTGAFPKFLVNAPKNGESMTIEEMCQAMCSSVNLYYGADAKVSASLVTKKEVDREYLDRIETGIETQYGKDVSVSKGVWVKLLVVYKKDGKEQEATQYARIYKINGSWVMLDVPSDTE